ncbi:MAG TPA: hypothetical protein PLU22_04215 [Polyangiaceae bacterium]|nr:hypothetical protein [Polyangiaceae bacterium]
MTRRRYSLCLLAAAPAFSLLAPARASAQAPNPVEAPPAAAVPSDAIAGSAEGPATNAAVTPPPVAPSAAAPAASPPPASPPATPAGTAPAPVTGSRMAPPAPAAPAATAPAEHRTLGVALAAELGFLTALYHTVQFSKDGSEIDYVKDAGQDVLFPFARLGADLFLRERTAITLVYQPLKIVTQEVAPRDLTIDDEVFARGTPMTFTYGFPFWRAGIARDVLRNPRHDLWLGGGLQIRDATIEFASLDGEQLVTNRNVGPVPLLRAAARLTFPSGRFLEGEVDGFYAPIKYINGAGTDVEGAVVDLSVRGGVPLADLGEVFLNLRYLGGGADGTGSDDGPGDGYTSNWLHFLTLSLGARLRML